MWPAESMIKAIISNNLAAVRQLIDNQEHLSTLDKQAYSYLHLSAFFNKVQISQELIKGGLRVDLLSKKLLTPLHSACYNNASAAVKLLIERGADLNARDVNWLTPLHVCAAVNSLDCLNYLNRNPVSLNVPDVAGCTPLHYSTSNGNFLFTRNLLSNGANPKAQDKLGRTCLHHAVMSGLSKIVQLILDQPGVNVNHADEQGLTPLHIACSLCMIDCVKLLVSRGADINQADNHGNTALFHALFRRQQVNSDALENFPDEIKRNEVCQYLIEQETTNLRVRNNLDLSLLHVIDSEEPMLKAFAEREIEFDFHDYLGRTPLHIACYRGYDHLLSSLIQNGCDIHARDKFNRIPLHYAVKSEHEQCVALLIKIDPQIVGVVDDNSCNSLHYAASSKNLKIWHMLTQVYPNLSQKDNFGRTVHFYGAHSEKIINTCRPLPSFLDSFNRNLIFYTLSKSNDTESRYCLLRLIELNRKKVGGFEITLNQRDIYGRTALHYAHLLKLDYHAEHLVINHASLYVEDDKGLTPIHYIFLTDNSAMLVNLFARQSIQLREDKYTFCLLQSAAYFGAAKCLRLLFEQGYIRKSSLTRSLEYATLKSNVECVEIILREMLKENTLKELYQSSTMHIAACQSNFECLSRLLANLDKCDIQDEQGRTPLMFALINCKEKNHCIRSLLKRKDCNPNLIDKEHHNALFYSVRFGNVEVTKELIKKGVNALRLSSSGRTIFHIAALSDNQEIINIVFDHCQQIGFSYHQFNDYEGFNPLHFACFRGNTIGVKSLIEKFPTKKYRIGSSHKTNFLHLAVYSGNDECVKLILNHFGPEISKETDASNKNAFHYFCIMNPVSSSVMQSTPQNTNSTQLDQSNILEHVSSSISRVTFNESSTIDPCIEIDPKHLSIFRLLMDNQVDLNWKDKYGRTPLMIALQSIKSKLDLFLIEDPAIDLTLKDASGRSVLHYATKYRKEIVAQRLIDKHRALVHFTDDEGETALHIASSEGLFDLTKYLLSSGASCFALDSDNFTPALRCAKNNDTADCLDLIIEVMIFEKSQTDNNLSASTDKESIRCSSPILENRKSLISQRSRRSELHSSFEDDIRKN